MREHLRLQAAHDLPGQVTHDPLVNMAGADFLGVVNLCDIVYSRRILKGDPMFASAASRGACGYGAG
jgi:hypothetical protein